MLKIGFTILLLSLYFKILEDFSILPVGKDQRKMVSQEELKLKPAKISRTPVFRAKMIDSTPKVINQSASSFGTEDTPTLRQ